VPAYDPDAEWLSALRPDELEEVRAIDAFREEFKKKMARRDLLQKRARERIRWARGTTANQRRKNSSTSLLPLGPI
jgi:hypothetical protein